MSERDSMIHFEYDKTGLVHYNQTQIINRFGDVDT